MNQKDFMHPECRNSELFFTNADSVTYDLIPFRTKRKGNDAYDGMGNKLKVTDWFPVFIEREELESMNALTSHRAWFRKLHVFTTELVTF